MPSETYWETFFAADEAIACLFGPTDIRGACIEFSCGYGTLTLPAARRITGLVTTLDIEPAMVECVRQKAATSQLPNIRAEVWDFDGHGAGVKDRSQAHAMIFNLLHLEQLVVLLREARRTLQDGGVLSVIHWHSDIPTPRGPALDIRPTPEQCRTWLAEAGFRAIEAVDLHRCCPFHFGLLAKR